MASNHGYSLASFLQACDDEYIVLIEQEEKQVVGFANMNHPTTLTTTFRQGKAQ